MNTINAQYVGWGLGCKPHVFITISLEKQRKWCCWVLIYILRINMFSTPCTMLCVTKGDPRGGCRLSTIGLHVYWHGNWQSGWTILLIWIVETNNVSTRFRVQDVFCKWIDKLLSIVNVEQIVITWLQCKRSLSLSLSHFWNLRSTPLKISDGQPVRNK